MFDFFSKEDKQLYNMLGHLNMAEKEISLKDNSETEIYEVAGPDDKYAFLHEAAIIEYHGTLFAAWYNCEEKELIGPTPIRQKRSKDGGKTWSDIETKINYICLLMKWYQQIIFMLLIFMYFKRKRTVLNFYGPNRFLLNSIRMCIRWQMGNCFCRDVLLN